MVMLNFDRPAHDLEIPNETEHVIQCVKIFMNIHFASATEGEMEHNMQLLRGIPEELEHAQDMWDSQGQDWLYNQ